MGVIFFYSFATLLRKEKKKSTLPDPALQASIFFCWVGRRAVSKRKQRRREKEMEENSAVVEQDILKILCLFSIPELASPRVSEATATSYIFIVADRFVEHSSEAVFQMKLNEMHSQSMEESQFVFNLLWHIVVWRHGAG